ncbi:hypothetical protein HanIR_Chr06g0274781 [Helianthus annuus]|nr:hypothetical protein HanIR_Chr06g0274781 [Helianthus annuus]
MWKDGSGEVKYEKMPNFLLLKVLYGPQGICLTVRKALKFFWSLMVLYGPQGLCLTVRKAFRKIVGAEGPYGP